MNSCDAPKCKSTTFGQRNFLIKKGRILEPQFVKNISLWTELVEKLIQSFMK